MEAWNFSYIISKQKKFNVGDRNGNYEKKTLQRLMCYHTLQRSGRADVVESRLVRIATPFTSTELRNFHPNSSSDLRPDISNP
jgi:hypothetical protein